MVVFINDKQINNEEQKTIESMAENLANIFVSLIDETHTPQNKDPKSYFEEIKN